MSGKLVVRVVLNPRNTFEAQIILFLTGEENRAGALKRLAYERLAFERLPGMASSGQPVPVAPTQTVVATPQRKEKTTGEGRGSATKQSREKQPASPVVATPLGTMEVGRGGGTAEGSRGEGKAAIQTFDEFI